MERKPAFCLSPSVATFRGAVAARSCNPRRTRARVVQSVAEVKTDNPAKASFPEARSDVGKDEAFKQLTLRLEKNGHKNTDPDMVGWFLADRRYYVDEAYDKITNMLNWRQRLQGVPREDVESEYQTGKVWRHEHLDVHGRTVLIVRANRHFPDQFRFENSERLIQGMMDEALSALPPESETVLGIIDMRGYKIHNNDVRLAKLFVDVFFTYYPRRLSQLMIIDAPLFFQPMWQLIRPLLRKYASLVQFVKLADTQKYFNAETMPDILRS